MAFNVKTLIRAELELDEAIYYYENIQTGLGNKFFLDYENQLNTLYTFPFFEEIIILWEDYLLKNFHI